MRISDWSSDRVLFRSEDVADLADGDVVLDAFDEDGHEVRVRAGGFVELLEETICLALVALGADAIEALDLAADDFVTHAAAFGLLLLCGSELIYNSEERRVGTGGVSAFWSGWSP